MGKVIPNIVKLSERVTEIDGRTEKLEKELKVLSSCNTKLEAKQEAYDQDMKAVHAKVEAMSKEMDNINAKFGKLDVSLQKTAEKQKINFRDIMKDQMEQEMMNVSETVKKEVSVSLENVTANIQQVQSDIQETRVEAAEQRDKETRRNNIMLYKVPESGEDRR